MVNIAENQHWRNNLCELSI